MELTSKNYWQSYYESSSEDRETIIKICSRYDKFWDILISKCAHPPKTILEIGAFPGRYLSYLSSRYALQAVGIDFNPDKEKFSRTMHAMGIEKFDYTCTDFLKHTPQERFDLVISNGFIEHFTNYDEVLDKHCIYLKKGGTMMIMIPNKRFIRSVYGDIVDRENQKAHHLDCMRKEVFENFALRNRLKVELLTYYGGFPYRIHGNLNIPQKALYRTVRFLSLKLNSTIQKHPGKWWSSTLIGIFSKSFA